MFLKQNEVLLYYFFNWFWYTIEILFDFWGAAFGFSIDKQDIEKWKLLLNSPFGKAQLLRPPFMSYVVDKKKEIQLK